MTRRYPAYRETGVEWAKELPATWSEGKLRWLSTRYSGGTPDKNNTDFWQHGSIPWLASGEVNQGTITEATAFISEEALDKSSAKWVPAGAVLMALAGQGKTKGMVARLAFRSTCNQSLAAIIPRSSLDGDYLYWWLASNYQRIRNMAGGDDRDGLNLDLIASIGIAVPPLAEQTAIAAFLDRETAKIDALVAEQRRLIDLLKEKRQAVISHTVTRGLNPAAKLKPSGVDWLGEVPEGWEVRPFKYFVRQSDGIQMGPFGGMLTDLPQEETEYKLYGQENVISGDFSRGHRWIEPKRFEELSGYRILPGDLVMTRKGSIGNCRIFPHNAQAGIADSDTIRVRLNEQLVNPALLLITLQEGHFIRVQFDLTKRGAILSGLNTSVVSNLLLPVAPLSEQAEILAFVRAETAKWEALLHEAETAIALLQERRAALISAAVTGKIDVRDLVPNQTEAA